MDLGGRMRAWRRWLVGFLSLAALCGPETTASAANRVICIKNETFTKRQVVYQFRWCAVTGACTLWTNASIGPTDDRRRYWIPNLPEDKPDGFLMEVFHPRSPQSFATTIVTGTLRLEDKDCAAAATYHFCGGDHIQLVPAAVGCATLRPHTAPSLPAGTEQPRAYPGTR